MNKPIVKSKLYHTQGGNGVSVQNIVWLLTGTNESSAFVQALKEDCIVDWWITVWRSLCSTAVWQLYRIACSPYVVFQVMVML